MAHYKDLRELYARSLEYHGIGYALYQPISAADISPPCAGFFDRNGNFNRIAKLTPSQGPEGLVPLEYTPQPQAQIGIEWKPKTSLGVQAITVDTSAEGPASGHVKYASKSSFGAVVIASKPVTMTGYNDERLFLAWLAANKEKLMERYGTQLRKYGLWIITQTHTAPGCWINAWQDKRREAVISLEAKANMLGGVSEGLNFDDLSSDRDWTHYMSEDGTGVVVFMDGIEVKPMEWMLQGLKQSIGLSRSTSKPRRSSFSSSKVCPDAMQSTQEGTSKYLTPSPIPTDRGRRMSTSPPSAATAARRASYAEAHLKEQAPPPRISLPLSIGDTVTRKRSTSTQRSSSTKRGSTGAMGFPSHNESHSPTDEEMLRDVGVSHSLSRSLSTISRGSSPQTPSLRRESRDLSGLGNSKHMERHHNPSRHVGT
ncbi:hypothetical protein FH972_026931 [Carpinus fangiana]|uniref:Uncharacterized protein n=1 Tax=Carpinus fangiana TaxID=176857 RepID=A0A5N6L5U5_9ROSI|nr:hypothetical protein FH972_026931 [Carpinus fangiana]